LIKYLKWVDKMQAKVQEGHPLPDDPDVAVVILTIVVMMGFVVPADCRIY
jgi:hypothetical protein